MKTGDWLPCEGAENKLAKGFALDIPLEVATITAQFTVVVGLWQPIVHGQQKALTVATTANENKIQV